MKIKRSGEKSKQLFTNTMHVYDHYIALDWSINNVAIARMRASSAQPKVITMNSQIKLIKEYAKKCPGTKILCIEETTGTHWLYVELKGFFDRILICDPYHNRLLTSGPKTDKIDAAKLCQLLRAGLLKEVYHSVHKDYRLRKVVSAYEDWIKFGVRFQNQKSALYRSMGMHYKHDRIGKDDPLFTFIESRQDEAIALYEEKKEEFIKLFKCFSRENPLISNLRAISGISYIFAVQIYSIVIDANRFENKYKYWGYAGLVKHGKESGGRKYGKRKPRYNRQLKSIYKSAALAAIGGKNDIREYYEYLLRTGVSIPKARNSIARYIGKVSYAMLKNKTRYIPYQWRKDLKRSSIGTK